jgi:hypothetical protein
MHRLFKTLFLLPWLSACTPTLLPGDAPQDWGAVPRPGLIHDFNWRLSGDRRVAPVQVFDDGRQTWLQFAPGQAMPALFIEHNGIERPAAYVRREPYVIVQGKWPSLVMRGGSLQARADYLGAAAHAAATNQGAMASPLTLAMQPAMTPATASATTLMAAHPLPDAGASVASTGPAPHGATSAPHAPRGRVAAQGLADSAAGRLYRVGPADENMRRALARWAGLAGWTFQPEHWAVDVDIPLSGSADFFDDFKRSVRALIAATELGERPLQPCFYANQVLRVVPLSQACDRTAARPGTSI